MKKIVLLSFLVAGMSAFAEMALVPINQLIKRGKSNAILVARNTKMSDIVRVAGYMAGRQMGENAPVAPVYAEGYFPTYRNDSNNTGLGFELQTWSSYLQKTVSANIFFYEEDNNLYVYLYQFKVTGNGVAKSSTYSSKKTDGSDINGAGSYVEPSTSVDGDGENPCLYGLRVWLAGRDRVANCVFWDGNGKMMWEGVSVSQLTDFSGVLTGGYSTYLHHLLGYNAGDVDGVRSVQLQTWGTNNMTRAVHINLTEADGAVNATVNQVWRDNDGDGFKVGGDSSSLKGTQAIANTENGNGIALRGVEALVDRRKPLARYAKFLQTSENRTVVWENVNINDILSIEGEMDGGWMQQAGKDRRPYHVKFEDGKFSLQYQAINDARLFCVKAVFVQNGANIEGYIEYARLVDLPADGVGLGFDFDSGDSRIKNQAIATGLTGNTHDGYGLKNVTAERFPEFGADVFVWKGATADGHLSNGDNWVGDKAPIAGAKLLFRDFASGVRIVNDYPEATCFEGLYFAGRGSVKAEFAGNAIKVATIDNLSEVASVHVSAPVVCDGNFEPWVGGGLAIDMLNVAGTLAPRGKKELGPLGTVNAAMLSGGNVRAWKADVYGLGGAFVRRSLNGAANASFDWLDTAGFTREVFEISGTNTVANRLELPNGQIFAVKEGLTSVPDIGASGEDPHVNLSAAGQLHIRSYLNQYERPVRFEGQGRVSFGETGYAEGRSDVFDGVAFGTSGNDYIVAGAAKPGADGKLRFAAKDPDGTFRAVTLTSALPDVTGVEILDGALKAGEVLNGRSVVVSGGVFEPLTPVAPSVIEFSGLGGLSATSGNSVELRAGNFIGTPKTYRFTGGSSISVPEISIDLTGATIIFDADFGTKTDVLAAASITGSPRVISARTGKTIPYSVSKRGDLAVLTVASTSPSLKIVIK